MTTSANTSSAPHSHASARVIESRLPGFRDLTPDQRLARISQAAALTPEQSQSLHGQGVLPMALANGMIENVIGTFDMPMGVATNFLINGRDYLIPMAVEEPSIVAGASYMARLARPCGGFTTSSTAPIMRAQIQILGLRDLYGARARLLTNKADIIHAANQRDTVLIGLGGGCKDIEIHVFESTPVGPMLVLHLLVDVRDAMGANTVNTMAETVAPLIERMSGGEVRLRILSNLADLRLARATLRLTPEALQTPDFTGERMAQGIVEACALALVDPYRAATHNKGIMNGIDPIVMATGNDWRAIEAGAHAYASRSGRYTSLSRWELDQNGHLVGTLEMPMALGLVGGATKTHPAAQAALALLNVHSATELAEVCVAVGLAQNMAALRALASEGIQRGHMALHAQNIAILAGATGDDIKQIAQEMARTHHVTVDHAKALLSAKRGATA
mgnify:FL=1